MEADTLFKLHKDVKLLKKDEIVTCKDEENQRVYLKEVLNNVKVEPHELQ